LGYAVTNEQALPGTCSSASEYIFPATLVQSYIKVPCHLRFVVLLALLRSQFEAEPSRKVVVFFSTCGAVDFHYALISEFHWVTHFQEVDEEKGSFIKSKTFRLHGNMAQAERNKLFLDIMKKNVLFSYALMSQQEAWTFQKLDALSSMTLQEM
jgi:ATP-dependent RNA helicase DDX31/DBP7